LPACPIRDVNANGCKELLKNCLQIRMPAGSTDLKAGVTFFGRDRFWTGARNQEPTSHAITLDQIDAALAVLTAVRHELTK
jgi:hypothetical protein